MFSAKPKLPAVIHQTCDSPMMMCSIGTLVWGFCETCQKAGNIKLWVNPQTKKPKLINASWIAHFTDESDQWRLK
jgi:hypothetical protein